MRAAINKKLIFFENVQNIAEFKRKASRFRSQNVQNCFLSLEFSHVQDLKCFVGK